MKIVTILCSIMLLMGCSAAQQKPEVYVPVETDQIQLLTDEVGLLRAELALTGVRLDAQNKNVEQVNKNVKKLSTDVASAVSDFGAHTEEDEGAMVAIGDDLASLSERVFELERINANLAKDQVAKQNLFDQKYAAQQAKSAADLAAMQAKGSAELVAIQTKSSAELKKYARMAYIGFVLLVLFLLYQLAKHFRRNE